MDEQNQNAIARRQLTANMTGLRKAAVLLVAVGEDLAKEVLRALPEADVQQLTEELGRIRGVAPEMSASILEEFWGLLDTQNFMTHGVLFGRRIEADRLVRVRKWLLGRHLCSSA